MYDVIFIGDSLPDPGLKSFQISPESLIKVKGEIGNFNIYFQTANGESAEITARTIVINIKAEFSSPISDLKTFTSQAVETVKQQAAKFTNENLLLIQDYPVMSPGLISSQGLKTALNAIRKTPDLLVYYFYRSMRFIDDNDSLFEEARKEGVVFLKYELENLNLISAEKLVYQREDIELKLTGEILLAPEIKPAISLEKIAQILNLPLNEAGFLQPENIYLQPTLTGRRGIYILGGSRGLTGYSNLNDEIKFTLDEIAALPVEIPNLAGLREVDKEKCVLCYTCYRICPHGGLEPDQEEDVMKVLNLACQGCDACIGHCPAGAISIVEEKEDMIESGLKVLMCENSAEPAWQKITNKDRFSDLKIETIPCAGSIRKEEIYACLKNQTDRLLILGCFSDSCKHISGDRKALRIVKEVNQQLESLNLGSNRVAFRQLAPRMVEDLDRLLLNWKED